MGTAAEGGAVTHIDLPATLRAAAVGIGLWVAAGALTCRWFWALKRMGGTDGE